MTPKLHSIHSSYNLILDRIDEDDALNEDELDVVFEEVCGLLGSLHPNGEKVVASSEEEKVSI